MTVTTLARVMSAALLLTANAANSAVLFGDNFESYAPGSNVNGQGGWFSNSSSFQLLAKPVSQLGSQAIDGRLPIYNIQWMYHSLPAFDTNAITTLSFDGYAFSGNPPSTNSGVGLQSSTSSLLAGLAVWWDVNRDSGGWTLDVRSLTGNASDRFVFLGHWDEIAHFKLVLDGVSNELYGIANFGGPDLFTPKYSISDSQIASLSTLTVFQDYQFNIGRQGAAFDNVLASSAVASVPEPNTYVLFFLSLAALSSVRRNKTRGNSQA